MARSLVPVLAAALFTLHGFDSAFGQAPAAPAVPVESNAVQAPKPAESSTSDELLTEEERSAFKTLLFKIKLGLNRREFSEKQRMEIERDQELLKELLAKQFEAAQQTRQAELKAARAKIAELEKQLLANANDRANILDRRLDALLATPINPREVFEGKVAKIVHVADGKVLGVLNDTADLQNNATALDGQAVLAADEPKKARRWILVPENGAHKLVNCNSGLVLDLQMSSPDPGAAILQWKEWAPPGYDNQRWTWEDDAKEVRIQNKMSGMVLDVGAENRIVQNPADPASRGQLWQILEADTK